VDITDRYGLIQKDIEEYDIIHLFVLNTINIFEKFKILQGKNIVFSLIYRDENYGE